MKTNKAMAVSQICGNKGLALKTKATVNGQTPNQSVCCEYKMAFVNSLCRILPLPAQAQMLGNSSHAPEELLMLILLLFLSHPEVASNMLPDPLHCSLFRE
jgi:hypothetical protein